MFARGVNLFLHSRTLEALLIFLLIWVWCGALFISLVYSVRSFYNNNIAEIIVFGRYGALKKAFKNYQLSLICRLVVAGYWSPAAGWSGWVVDVSSTGWN